jgi:hypothetical protein
MDEAELRSLQRLIKSGGLVDGRDWNGISNQIDEMLNPKKQEK